MNSYKFINTSENRQKLNTRRFYPNHGTPGFWYAYVTVGGYRIEVDNEGRFAYWRNDFNGAPYDDYDIVKALAYIDGMVADGILEVDNEQV